MPTDLAEQLARYRALEAERRAILNAASQDRESEERIHAIRVEQSTIKAEIGPYLDDLDEENL